MMVAIYSHLQRFKSPDPQNGRQCNLILLLFMDWKVLQSTTVSSWQVRFSVTIMPHFSNFNQVVCIKTSILTKYSNMKLMLIKYSSMKMVFGQLLVAWKHPGHTTQFQQSRSRKFLSIATEEKKDSNQQIFYLKTYSSLVCKKLNFLFKTKTTFIVIGQ